MHIVCNSHSIFDAQLVSNLTDCSLKVSLLPGNDFAANLCFYGADFKSLIDKSMGNTEFSDQLIRRKFLRSLLSDSRYFLLNLVKKLYAEDDNNFYDLESFWYMADGASPELLKKELESVVDSKNGIKVLIDLLKIFKDEFSTLFNDYKLKSDKHQFNFDNNVITINECISIHGQSLEKLLTDVKDYTCKHAPYIIENNLAKDEETYIKYSDFLARLNALDLDSYLTVQDYTTTDPLLLLIKEMDDLFVFNSI